MKDKKGNGKVISQAVCNLGELAYMPEKGKNVFESKLNLKFHKAYNFTNLLKPHAMLHLNVVSVLKDETDRALSPKTALKTIDHRRYLSSAGGFNTVS